MVAARADGAHGEGADAVGATHVELLAVGRVLRVAVSPDDTGVDVTNQRTVLRELPRLDHLRLNLEELGIGIVEHLLAFLAPFPARHHVAERQQVG